MSVSLFEVTFGNLNDTMMEKISNAGNGMYAMISSADHAVSYAHNDLWNTANLIAKDVKIQVQFDPEQVLAYRLIGYENRNLADEDFDDATVDAGEVGSGHSVTALYEVVQVGQTIPQPEGAPEPLTEETTIESLTRINSWVRVRVRYKSVQADDAAPSLEIVAEPSGDTATRPLTEASTDLQWAAAVAAFAELLKGSPYSSIGHLETIEALVTANVGTAPDRQEFAALFSKAQTLLP